MVHNLDFPPHILNILLIHQLPLGNRFASKLLARGLIRTQMCHPKLSPPQLLPYRVHRPDVFHGPAQDRPDRGLLGRLLG